MLEQRTVSCSHLEGLLGTLVSITLWYENCGRWAVRTQMQSSHCPDSFRRCLALSSELSMVWKGLTGSTAIVFSQTSAAFGGISPVWKDHMIFLMWFSVQSMRIGMSNAMSNQTCCRHPFLEHHNYSSLEEVQLHVSVCDFPKYFSLVCPKNQSISRMQNERQIWAPMNSVLTGSIRANY